MFQRIVPRQLLRLLTAAAIVATGAGRNWAQPLESLERGASLYRSANCRAAILELLPAAATHPKANLLLGRCYLELEQYSQAIDALTSYRKSLEKDPLALILLAQATEKDGRGDAAASLLNEHLLRYPNETEIHNALGDLYARLGRGPDAMAQYQMVTNDHADNPGARIGRGWLALHEEKWEIAIEELEKARTLVPEDQRVLQGVGTAYLRLGHCEQAVGPLRQALKLAPDDFVLAKNAATCYVKLGKWTDVWETLRSGTVQESGDEEATAMVVKASQETGNASGAEIYYRQVLTDSPSNVRAHIALGEMLEAARHSQEARAQYLAAVMLRPDLPAINERLGDITQAEKNFAEARRYYEAAARSKGGTDDARVKLAQVCLAAEDLECARNALSPVGEPRLDREVKTLRAQLEFKAKNWEAAGRLANELLLADRQNLKVLRIAAEVALKQSRDEDAAALFEQALKLEPGNKELRYQIVEIYSNAKDPAPRLARAKEILTEFLTKYERDAKGYLLLANVYFMLNDHANADSNFRLGFDLVSLPIPPSLSWAYTVYGELLFERGGYEQARVYQTKAADLNPKDATSRFNLAVTCLQLRRMDEVREAREKLVELQAQELIQKLDRYVEKASGRVRAGKRAQ